LVAWRASLDDSLALRISANMLLEVVSLGQMDMETLKSILDPGSMLPEPDVSAAYGIVQKARGSHATVDPLALISF
jgi:hypothetical protein